MTIEEIRQRRKELQEEFSRKLETFEAETGCTVEGVEMSHVCYNNVEVYVPVVELVVRI